MAAVSIRIQFQRIDCDENLGYLLHKRNCFPILGCFGCPLQEKEAINEYIRFCRPKHCFKRLEWIYIA